MKVMSLHRYPSPSGGTAFGKMGVGQKLMTSFVVPTSLDQLAAVVRAFGTNREAARALLCPQDSMVEVPDTWTAENGTVYSNPRQVVDVDFMENADGETLLYAITIPKYASAAAVAFDQRNQEPAVEATAQSGVDYYGFAPPHDTAHAYASGECCTYDGALYRAPAAIAANTAWDPSKWALQGYISADGTIPVHSAEATYPANSIVRYTSTALGFTGMFKNSAAIATAGAFDPSKWTLFVVDAAEASFIKLTTAEGDALDYSGYAALMRTDLEVSSGNGVRNVLHYGYNNWGQSAQRQYFNDESDTPRGWFHQTHPGQIAPFGNIGQIANAVNSVNYGYRHGCSAELLRNVHAVKVPTWPNYVTDGPNNASTVYHTLDTFWLPSGRQWVGNVNANEGEVFPGLLWQYIRALRAAGRKVVPYDATAEGEVGTVYVNASNGQFYTYRPDITSGTKYSNFTNDDGSWFRDYRTKTIEEVATNADRGSDTSKVYFVTSTQKMWRVNGSSWAEVSHEWYTYNAIGKPTSGVSPLNGARRSFAVTNYSSAVFVRLRSAGRGNSYSAWYCYSNGNVSNGYAVAHYFDLMRETIWGPEALYRSACKCFKGVGRKHSTQSYKLHVISNTVNLAKAHRDGKYKEKPPKVVPIQYPKKRTAMSISLVDRVTQRSLNDLSLYPQTTRRFIYANYACQKGKGTDAAREYYAAMLHRAWLKYGTSDFRIVVVDVKGYYDNMDHKTTNAMFAEMCDPWTAAQATRTLDKQYKGDKGYSPGSQAVQIAGISYLNKLDHYMKEVLRRKLYIRYMDDIHIVAKDEADAAHAMEEVSAQLTKVGLFAHPVKSRIVDAREGTVFLGFLHRVADNGKVLVSCDPAKVKANRRKMRRIANKIMHRRVHRTALAESWQSMYNHLAKGNSKRLERRMTELYNNLEKEIEGATS